MIKKVISSILTVALLASCITFSGNEAKVKADNTTTIDSNSQILFKGKLNEVEEDKVTTLKTIAGTEVENEFEITLQVTTEEDLKNIKISPDSATVLVLDTSGSMANDKRFEAMQVAAKSFLTDFAKVESGSNVKRLVSIVSFASNVKNETYSNGKNNWIDVANSSANLNQATNIINGLQEPNGGTNIEGALIMANNIVKDGKTNKTLEGIDNINIILLTDGCPTFHVRDSSTNSISTIRGVEGGSNKSYTTDWKPVGGTVNNVSANSNNISNKIKGSDINLYTIAFSTSDSKFYTKDPTMFYWNGDNGESVYLNPSTWMESFATRNFSAKDVNELTKQFEAINEMIRLSAKAWKVTDPMGSNIIYEEITDSRKDNAYNFNNNILSWDIKNSTPTISTTNDGNKKYTYTLKYNIILDTTNKDFNYKEVLTNGETILDYYLFSTDNSKILKHASFNVPKVEGLFGSLNFTKVNEKNVGMSRVLFTLSGTATGSNKPVEMQATSDENGDVAFSNIPAGVYKLTETTPSGYVGAGPWDVVVSYGNTTKGTTLGDTIVNYPTSRSISVTKRWEGLTNGQSTPENVTVRLYKNDVETDKTLVLNSINNWTGSFTNLPYIDENGVINYSVKEDIVAGYYSSTLENEDGSIFTITNTYKPDLIDISGKKSWVDKDGESSITGEVPDITITLQRTLADNWNDETKIEDVQSVTLTNGKTDYIFKDMPMIATNGEAYKYRVKEAPVNGYTPIYTEDFNIVNKYTPENTEVIVNKTWENIDLNTDKVPEVTINLYQNGTLYANTVLTKTTGYSYKFEGLPKYAKTGVEYEYTVQEGLKEGTVGYSSSNSGNINGVVTVTNTFDTTKINVKGQKQWEGVPDGAQVPAVTLKLYQDGKEVEGKVITLESGVKETREYTFENLPKYSTEGKEYNYTVVEEAIPGYVSSGEGNSSNGYVITNTFTPETIPVIGDKTWSNITNINNVPAITIYLERSLNGTDWTRVEGQVKELPAGTTHYEFTNLPKYASNGQEYQYRVSEDDIDGYITQSNGSYNLLNVYTPGDTSVRVTKKWTNVDPKNDKVPEVMIVLKQDGTTIQSIILDSSNNYTHTFTKLAKYAETGKEYVYTVEEVLGNGVEGYTQNITSQNDGYIVENIFDNTTIDINFTKVWEGISEDSVVPSIKLHLYQNDIELTDKAVTLESGVKSEGKDVYVFEDLPKFSTDGNKYNYKVVEEVPNGYTSTGEAIVDADNNATITNTFDSGSVDVSGTKTWNMVNESDLSSVPTITIRLQSSTDGIIWSNVNDKVVELKAGELAFEFKDLPEYSVEGNKYQYRVVEDNVDGYKSLVDLNNNITNTYDPGETSVKVTKKWTNVDSNNDKVPEVKIILRQNGTEVSNVVLDKENEYTYTFENLAKYAPTGKEYEYTVDEVLEGVVGYTKEISSGSDGYVVENIFDKDATVDIKFSKVWENVPQGSEVPSIKLHLYQDGVELKDKVLTIVGGVKENGTESYVFKNLPKYSTEGKEYVYTIKEDNINGYTSSGEANVKNNYVITNTYDGGEKVVINGTKTWVNVKDVSKVPDITIRVLRDGKEIHSIIVPSGTTTYEISAESMVKYAPDGHEYEYELTEDKLDGFKSERDGYNFTNTNTVKEAVSGISDIKTGDNNMILMYSSLAILSLSLISIITLRKKKKSFNK